MSVAIDYELCCWVDGKCKSVSGCCCSGQESAVECEGCVTVCPTGAISRDKCVGIDDSLCDDCGICIESCPHGALS